METAAVKRVDMVSIGASPTGEPAVSFRHERTTLKPYNAPKKLVKEDAGLKDKIVVEDDDNPGVEIFDSTVKFTKNLVLLDRYLDKTATSRKLPVAIVLIVGPEHIARIQAALVSSPLRFLETQVLWLR